MTPAVRLATRRSATRRFATRRPATPRQIARIFSASGGTFVTPAPRIARALENIRALVFDWDGVFHDGRKREGRAGSFAEPDSMGVNMLRYALWRRDRRLPIVAIISGERDPAAVRFGARERFHAHYWAVRDKRDALRHLCEAHDLELRQVCWTFDDFNDLGLAERCGLRLLVRRRASPLFARHAIGRRLCDYVTAGDPSTHAVRETCEMLLGLMGAFDAVARSRARRDATFARYSAERRKIETESFTQPGRAIVGRKTSRL